MDTDKGIEITRNRAECFPVLRKALGLIREKPADTVGISRPTVACIGNKESMGRNALFSFLLIFSKNGMTNGLLSIYNFYTSELNGSFHLSEKSDLEVDSNG